MKQFLITLFTSLLFLSSPFAWGLQKITIPQELQTKKTRPAERKIYLKLPLSQANIDWIFDSKEVVLEGAMALRIMRGNKVEEIIIFNKGILSPDWEFISSPEPLFPQSAYFGFVSDNTYLTAPGDTIELVWYVPKDVEGMGPDFTATLPKGTYRATGKYSGLTDNFDTEKTRLYRRIQQSVEQNMSPDADKEAILDMFYEKLDNMYNDMAFLHDWDNQWEMTITSNAGWKRVGNV